MSPNKKVIMIVDEDETDAVGLCVLLNSMGFDVIPSRNTEDVIELIEKFKPDMVILDVSKQGHDGVDTLRVIKEDESLSSLPVAIMSADPHKDTIAKCKQLGYSAYLTKPVKVGALHSVLQICIYSRFGWKRQHVRVNFNVPVTVRFEGKPYGLYTETISEGGMYIRKKSPFPVGSEVAVSLPYGDGKSLDLKGTVIYTVGMYGDVFTAAPGMAVEFKDMKKADSLLLLDFISRLIEEKEKEYQEVEPREEGAA